MGNYTGGELSVFFMERPYKSVRLHRMITWMLICALIAIVLFLRPPTHVQQVANPQYSSEAEEPRRLTWKTVFLH
jgi:hypothetical protein